MPEVFDEKLDKKAKVPARGAQGLAGYDIIAIEGAIIPAHSCQLISTSIAIQLPEAIYGRLAPCSSLATKHSINIGAGVINSDFRDE
eukprot:1840402-Ditylum_brightwellii.AAC.1